MQNTHEDLEFACEAASDSELAPHAESASESEVVPDPEITPESDAESDAVLASAAATGAEPESVPVPFIYVALQPAQSVSNIAISTFIGSTSCNCDIV